ncbi:MAG: hypothetical protein QOE90_3465, partial [Thermoplasmata archaeon]|nr:hypothetical protein [Thermoplasmata archaeon]
MPQGLRGRSSSLLLVVSLVASCWIGLAPARAASTLAEHVVTGAHHACARLADGTVDCWGDGSHGIQGDASVGYKTRPGPVTGMTDAVQIVAGYYHTCALHADGTVSCWGRNLEGELGDGTTMDRSTPVPVQGLSGVKLLSAGFESTCALLQDQTARCWGRNALGELGDGTQTMRTTPVLLQGVGPIADLSVGLFHACALLQDGTAACWGDNGYGDLGDDTTGKPRGPVAVAGLASLRQIHAGYQWTCAVLADATVDCWGNDEEGEMGDGTTSTAARPTPAPVPGLAHVASIGSLGLYVCALLQDGSATCWGDNLFGNLGDGTTTRRLTPVPVAGLAGATSLSSSIYTSCATLRDGSARCWGSNDAGQIGDGTTTTRATPVPVLGLGPPAPATIRVAEDAELGESVFTYALSPGGATCSIDTSRATTCDFADLDPSQTYSVTEISQVGWRSSGPGCSGVRLSPGATLTCAFRDVKFDFKQNRNLAGEAAPSAWPGDALAQTQGCGTIAAYGCALTSLTDVLAWHGVTRLGFADGTSAPLDPGTLDRRLAERHAFDVYQEPDGEMVCNLYWTVAAKDLGFSLTYDAASAPLAKRLADVDAALARGSPAIVKILEPLRDAAGRLPYAASWQPTYGAHWIVLTAKGPDAADGSPDYVILDPNEHAANPSYASPPGWGDPRDRSGMLFSQAYPGETIAGLAGTLVVVILDEGAATGSAWTVSAHSPVQFLVTDPNGARTGVDPATGDLLDEIPGASYGLDAGIGDESGERPPMPDVTTFALPALQDGDYQVQVVGTGQGAYGLTFAAIDASGATSETAWSGATTLGQSAGFALHVEE